ncbi:hypothetical protein [Enterococcus gilvus]|uniref:hypothetical protein n=1 Tax=Enterococcus gilvus TaxID=160453 RepID=UPI00345E8C87
MLKLNKTHSFGINFFQIRITVVYILLLLSFFLSDWRLPVGGVSFSDLFAAIAFLLTLGDLKNLKKNQILFVMILLCILSVNIYTNFLCNPLFDIRSSWVYFGKFLVYSLVLCNTYNLTRDFQMESLFFKLLNTATLISILFALVIYLIQILHLSIPYEILWRFTRTDIASYTFRGSSMIRMRGLSSEPSYFGSQILLILTINYFNQFGFRFNSFVEWMTLLCGILSFSFSVVPILLFLKICDFINSYGLSFIKRYWFVLLLILSMGVVVVFFDQFYITFFDRVITILNKQDTSASSRIVGSWQYVQNIFIGNGVGMTAPIWNNFAYVLSDFGLIPFLGFLFWTLYLLKRNFYFGMFFILISFQKGGYLSFYYWLTICLFIIFSTKKYEAKKEVVFYK